MPSLGAVIAIISDGHILLTQREDFEVWCLPGGAVDDGESLAQAAIREALEETGLEVLLTRLVGIYSQPIWHHGGHHFAVFAAQPVGGELRLTRGETVDAGYFSCSALPYPFVWWHRQPILDALSGVGGSAAWALSQAWPFEQRLTRQAIYAMCHRSGLSRQQFFLQEFERADLADDLLEVGGGDAYEPPCSENH